MYFISFYSTVSEQLYELFGERSYLKTVRELVG